MRPRPDPADWMWAQACDVIDQAERMHRRFFRLGPSARAGATWEPPADVFEDADEILVVVALPGVAADGVQIAAVPGALVVRAERPLPFARSGHNVRQLEIPYGRFERRIPLPHLPLELESHELTHGCLVLRLRKAGSRER